jgi:transposase
LATFTRSSGSSRAGFPGDAAAQALRHQLRHERSRTITDGIKAWATEQIGLPRSELGKAVRYMLERWTGLARFLDNPCIPLDNMRPSGYFEGPVVGRKNHYGSKSLRGTQVAALFYTLCESAKLVGVDPHMYLLTATEAALATPGTVTLPAAVAA